MNDDFSNTLANVLGPRKRKPSARYRSVKDGDLINPIQLDEFLEGVGGMLRLPPRETAAPAGPKAKTAKFPLSARAIKIGLAIVGVMVAGMMINRPPTTQAETPLPPQLIGRWTTADPRYRDRSLEITSGFLAFKNGERRDDQTVHQISGVRTEIRGDTTLVTLDYLEADATYHLAMKYLPRPTPAIIFANQEELVWRRQTRVSPTGSP